MHSDERAELKNEFIIFLDEKGWTQYLVSEKNIEFFVNFMFRTLYCLCVVSVLGFAFASMRNYIPRIYGWVSLGLAVLWIMVEQINLKKLDNLAMKRKQKILIQNLYSDDLFINKLSTFENLDIIPEKTVDKIQNAFMKKDYPKMIESIKQIFFYLKAVRTLEESQRQTEI